MKKIQTKMKYFMLSILVKSDKSILELICLKHSCLISESLEYVNLLRRFI